VYPPLLIDMATVGVKGLKANTSKLDKIHPIYLPDKT